MRASLKLLTVGLLLFVPLSTAHAQGPLLSPIANVSVNAGHTLSVNVIAVDPDGRVITVTAALPPFATLNTPTIGTGVVVTSLTLTPSAAHVGDYTAAVTATAGGVSNVRVFQITVNAAGSDQAPIVVAPPLQGVTAGSALTFVVTASDPDANPITSLTASGLPTGASFTPNASNTEGSFSWTPAAEDTGEYDVLFTAANALSGTSVTHLRVSAAPTLMITPIADVTVAAGGSASVPVHASGVPGAMITLTASLPAFATLNPPGSGTGVVNTTVTISPPMGSAGTYHASITATSQANSVTEPFDIIVTGTGGGGNHPPVLTAPPTATVAVNSTLTFDVTATDPDGDHVDLSGTALPPGSTFTDNGNDTGTFTWTPVSGQAGTYTASFTGLDGRGGSGSASTVITVTGGTPPNRAPIVNAPATEQVNEGVHLSFAVTASDSDGDPVALSTGSLPTGATFTDHGNNTGTFSWTPDTTQSGTYTVAFLGNDGHGGTGTASTIITVMNVTGGGEIPGRACLIGKFKHQRETTCFRIRPVEHSFDLRDVVLSSIRLRSHGESLAALAGAAIELDCPQDHHHGNGNGQGEDGDDDHGDGDDDGGKCNVSCPDHDGDDPHDGDDDHNGGHHHDGDDPGDHGNHHDHGDACDTLGIRACFATDALLRMFPSTHGNRLPCALVDAQIVATLMNGATVVARFGTDDDGDHHDHGDDNGDHKGKGHEADLKPQVKPNPLNPGTELSFTMAQDGQVQVIVYDMQGRVVKTLLNEFRPAGEQKLAWDGTNQSNLRVPSGVYFLRIRAQEGSVTRRVAVLK